MIPPCSAVPLIQPVTPGPRPRLSVMVPTYRPGEMLRLTLESVLAQAVSHRDMQIAVVDDGSDRDALERIVRSVDLQGRVEIHADGPHLGLSGNWNRAIGLARGHLVHLLHQDDCILPGFYARMERGFLRAPLIGMAFCPSRIVDGQDRLIKSTWPQRWRAGVIANWLPRIAIRQRIQTPAVVVARTTYEMLGGYRNDLCHTLDWEMWVRIAARMPVWHEPRPLAVYRRHEASESSRLLAQGMVWPDLVHAIHINAESFADQERSVFVARSARWYAGSALRTVEKQIRCADPHSARMTLAHARRLLECIGDVRLRSDIEGQAAMLDRRIESLAAA
jgi:glycosyltransferase involved in cell wall biosynthesis